MVELTGAAQDEWTTLGPALAARKKMLEVFEAGALPLELCNHSAGWFLSCASAMLLTHCPGGPPITEGLLCHIPSHYGFL